MAFSAHGTTMYQQPVQALVNVNPGTQLALQQTGTTETFLPMKFDVGT